MGRRPSARASTTAPRRQPRQERSRERVQAMLDAAASIIDARGIDAVTTNAIADEAGVPVGTIYQFFPNRDAVLVALLERQLAAFDQRIEPLVSGHRAEVSPAA